MMCACIVNNFMNHREILHKGFIYAFPCISLVHEVLHYAFTSTEVVYAWFLVRVLLKSTFVCRFGHVALCDMLVDATYVCM